MNKVNEDYMCILFKTNKFQWIYGLYTLLILKIHYKTILLWIIYIKINDIRHLGKILVSISD